MFIDFVMALERAVKLGYITKKEAKEKFEIFIMSQLNAIKN